MLTGGVIIPPRFGRVFFLQPLFVAGIDETSTSISPCDDFTRSPSLIVYSSTLSVLSSSQFLKSARRATSSHSPLTTKSQQSSNSFPGGTGSWLSHTETPFCFDLTTLHISRTIFLTPGIFM